MLWNWNLLRIHEMQPQMILYIAWNRSECIPLSMYKVLLFMFFLSPSPKYTHTAYTKRFACIFHSKIRINSGRQILCPCILKTQIVDICNLNRWWWDECKQERTRGIIGLISIRYDRIVTQSSNSWLRYHAHVEFDDVTAYHAGAQLHWHFN